MTPGSTIAALKSLLKAGAAAGVEPGEVDRLLQALSSTLVPMAEEPYQRNCRRVGLGAMFVDHPRYIAKYNVS
jgi:hypothetical protein